MDLHVVTSARRLAAAVAVAVVAVAGPVAAADVDPTIVVAAFTG